MTTDRDAWTCPECEVTERLDTADPAERTERLRAVQTGHGARHAAERANESTTAEALLDATEVIAAFRVRVCVAPTDVERVRRQVQVRSLPIEVFADGRCQPGRGYVMQPRKGVRERAR